MNAKLLTLLFVLCSYFLIASNLPFYQLTIENFHDDFDAIDDDHLEAFLPQNSGVGIDSVERYLEDLIRAGSFRSYLPAPTMCVEDKSKDSIYIEAEGEFDSFYFSYFRAQSGDHETTISHSNNFAALMEHDLFFNLLAIYASSGNDRTDMYIIIIDKDLFFCDTIFHHPERQIGDLTYQGNQMEEAIDIEFNSFPNPTSNQTSFSFQLEEAQKVSLEIGNSSTGKIIARKLEDQYLLAGSYQYDFDLEVLPAGMYFFVLKTKYQRQSIPIIKIR